MRLSQVLDPKAVAPVEEAPPAKTKAVDLFEALGALFRGQDLPVPPSPFIMHRFLASQQEYAELAKAVQMITNDPQQVFAIWKSAVSGRMPRLTYVGPKTQAGAEGLVAALMEKRKVNRTEAEDLVLLLEGAGKFRDALAYYGVETEEDKAAAKPKKPRAPRKKK